MKVDKFIVAVFGVTILALIVGLIMVSGSGSSDVEANENVKLIAEEKSHAWGNIGIDDGNVEAEFEIKNEGSDTLKLSDVVTSCMCTTAKIISGGKESPSFGMHTKSDYVAEIAPGETGKLKVIFDPAYHGPNGVGPITRQVTMNTNDPDNPEIVYMLTANVTR